LNNLIHLIFLRTWWTYERDRGLAFSAPYHWFNLFEGAVWILFALLVFARFLRRRNSSLEIWYAVAFFTFGLSDFREAWVQSSPLLWFKGANLAVLFYLRWVVLKRYYPDKKLV
jgi:hypothetical protein